MKKLALVLVAVCSLALTGLVAALALLLFTGYGGPWAFKLAAALSKGRLEAAGVRGGLLDTLDIERLSFKSKTVAVVISHAHLHWNPRELLARTSHIYALTAAAVEVTTYPSPSAPFTPLPVQLPLKIVLDHAQVGRIVVHTTGTEPGEFIRLSNFAAAGRWDDEGLKIARAAVVYPPYGVLGVAGRLRLEGDAVHFDPIAIAGPGRLRLTGTLGLNNRPSKLEVRGEELHWPLTGQPQLLASETLIRFDGRPRDAVLALSARLLAALPDGAQASSQVRSPSPPSPPPPGGKGVTSMHEKPSRKPAQSPSPPAGEGLGERGSRAGESGSQAKHLGFVLKADAHLAAGAVSISRLLLTAEDPSQGSVTGSGNLAWQPALNAQARLVVAQLNPGLVLPDWPGRLNGRAEVSTTLQNGTPRLRFAASLTNSSLRGRNFGLETAGSYLAAQPAQLLLDKLLLSSGSARLTAAGRVLPDWKADAELSAGNLNDLYPGLSGSAHARLSLAGALRLPRVNAEAQLNQLKLRDLRLAQASLAAKLDPAKTSTATLSAQGLVLAGRTLNTLKAEFQGRPENHELSITTTAPQGSAAVSFKGRTDLDARQWQGWLQTATLDAAQAPRLVLTAPAPLNLSAREQSLSNACFSAGSARACLSGRHAGEATHASFSLSQFGLATLQPLLPKNVLVDAVAEGQGTLTLAGSVPTDANIELHLGAGRILLPAVPAIALRTARLTVQPQASIWAASLTANTDQGTVDAHLSTPRAGSDWAGRPLAGQVAVNIPSLAFLQGFATGTESLDGRVRGTVALTGTLSTPRFTGSMNLSEGRARVPVAGIAVSNIRAAVTGSETGVLLIEAQAQSGEGVLKVQGTATTTARGVQARFTAKGENIQVCDLADYRVWLSPDLVFAYAPEGASLSGTVLVPRAAITPRKLAGGTVSASPDAVVAGREAPPPRSLPITTNVLIVLGDDVRFEGFGLKARIAGQITAFDAPGLAVTRGRGELRVVDGRYQAYGQDLTLQTGRLLFAGGPLQEPTVDFKAVRQLREDLSVSVLVRGTLKAPMLDLSSSPAMSREEQLSWLVLGRPLASTSGAERSQVSAAALSLGLTGGELLAGRIGKTLGFDEVSVGAQPGDAVDQARMTIGKHLSPRLYVSYGMGLFERNNVFRLLYDLNHGFKLRTETGLHAGGDVLYTVDH